jgi:hypothetical protein
VPPQCGRDITVEGYAHFGDKGCVLFDQAEVDRWNRMVNPDRNVAQEMIGLARAGGGDMQVGVVPRVNGSWGVISRVDHRGGPGGG